MRPLVSGLRALGVDPRPLMASAGLAEGDLADPDGRIPTGTVHRMLAQAVQLTGDECLGLHLAEHAEIESFDLPVYVVLSSPTLGVAFERLGRYQRLIHDATTVTLEKGDHAKLKHALPGGLPVPRQSAELVLTAWVRAGRMATGLDLAPVEVRFAHEAPADTREHRRFFRATVRFSAGENALLLPLALLDAPCLRADPGLLAVLDRHADAVLERTPQSHALADRARQALMQEVGGGGLTAPVVATRLRMSLRSLHRGLRAEGTTFGALLGQLRRELAERHLRENRRSISEIAFLLGFSELSSFHRAYRQWTGRTPAEARRARPRP